MNANNMTAYSIAYDLVLALNRTDGDPRCQRTVDRVVQELGLGEYYSHDVSKLLQSACPNPIHAVCYGGEYATLQYQTKACRWF